MLAGQPQPADAGRCPFADASLADLLAGSRTLQQRDENTQASACFALATDRAAGARDTASEAAARLGLAQTLLELTTYTRASEEAGRARALFERLGDRLGVARSDAAHGAAAFGSGRRPEAERLYRSAIAAFEALGADADRAASLVSFTIVATLPAAEELQLLDEAIAIARRLSLPRVEARGLHNRADRAFADGQFDAAVTDLARAIELFRSEDQPTNLSDAYVSMGRIHRAHGQPEAAIGFYDQAAAIQERIGDLRGLVQSTNAKAVALSVLGRRAETRAAYERALAIARQTGVPRLINFQQGNLAAAIADAGDHRGAIALLEEVITRETDPYILAYRHAGLAGNYLAVGEPQAALEHAHQSIKLADQTNNRELLPALLITRARVFRALGRPAQALADAQTGTRLLEAMRARLVPLDFMKRGFSQRNQEIYGVTISLMHERGEAAASLVVSEQARSRAFLDLLASRSLVAPAAAIPLALPRVGAGQQRDSDLASYAAATSVSEADIERTAARLHSTIVAYWVDADGLFIWVAAPGAAVRSARVPVPHARLEETVSASLPNPIGADLDALRRLHGWLIEPVAAWLPPAGGTLTIVPHGPLFRLSFAALRDNRGAYLIERYALGYSPSISAFRFTEQLARDARRQPLSYLLVADPTPLPHGLDASPLEALPASLREASGIRRTLGPATSSLVLTHARASEPGVRQAMPSRRIIHLATHAFMRDDEPLESFLALGVAAPAGGPTTASVEGNGRLSVRELYDLHLTSELVILSACRTATGRLSGDGIAGLSRALFYAGAASVMATQWDVADEPSARLMVLFYDKWRGQADKRRALRAAQLEMIRLLRAGTVSIRTKLGTVRLREQPFNWAGYLLFGEP